jgi:hypothetical protein
MLWLHKKWTPLFQFGLHDFIADPSIFYKQFRSCNLGAPLGNMPRAAVYNCTLFLSFFEGTDTKAVWSFIPKLMLLYIFVQIDDTYKLLSSLAYISLWSNWEF